MEGIKKFIEKPKNQIAMGLLSGLILIFRLIVVFISPELKVSIFYFSTGIGLFVYFSFVKLRMNKQNANIEIAQKLLLVTYILSLICSLLFSRGNGIDLILTTLLYTVTTILYFINIFFKKGTKISNKIFLGVSLISVLYGIIMYVIYFTNMGTELLKEPRFIADILVNFSKLLIIPYFYNYYKMLKGEK